MVLCREYGYIIGIKEKYKSQESYSLGEDTRSQQVHGLRGGARQPVSPYRGVGLPAPYSYETNSDVSRSSSAAFKKWNSKTYCESAPSPVRWGPPGLRPHGSPLYDSKRADYWVSFPCQRQLKIMCPTLKIALIYLPWPYFRKKKLRLSRSGKFGISESVP